MSLFVSIDAIESQIESNIWSYGPKINPMRGAHIATFGTTEERVRD